MKDLYKSQADSTNSAVRTRNMVVSKTMLCPYFDVLSALSVAKTIRITRFVILWITGVQSKLFSASRENLHPAGRCHETGAPARDLVAVQKTLSQALTARKCRRCQPLYAHV